MMTPHNNTPPTQPDAQQPADEGLDDAICSADCEKLTPEQIKNWRNALLGMIGPYALLMPDEEVQQMRDNMQSHFSEPNAKIVHPASENHQLSPTQENV
jgi:hypothetical protein